MCAECVPMLSDVTFALSRGIVSTGANRTSGSPAIPASRYTGRVMSMTMVRICITIPGLYFIGRQSLSCYGPASRGGWRLAVN